MREFFCAVCGKKAIDNSFDGCRLYCSKKCKLVATKAKNGWGDIPCRFNQGVNCGVSNCENCGWNPEVEKKRKEALGCEELMPMPC